MTTPPYGGTRTRVEWAQAGSPITLSWVSAGQPSQVVLTPEGSRVWVAAGEPFIVVGAEPGDFYLDSDSGLLYRLS